MQYLLGSENTRPNRLESEKDEEYHIKYGRYCASVINDPQHRKFLSKCSVNWNFYKNDQWIIPEDLEQFLQDEYGEARQRIKMTKNLIRRIVNQYVGNAIRMSHTARVASNSRMAITRREKELDRVKLAHEISDKVPDFISQSIKKQYNLGDTPEESEEIFQNSYVDKKVRDLNNLLKRLEKQVDIEDIKVRLATQAAITGLYVYYPEERNGDYIADVVDSFRFHFDMAANKWDLSDAEHWGHWEYVTAPDIFEAHQGLTDKERSTIEKHVNNKYSKNSANQNNFYDFFNSRGKRIMKFTEYWVDCEEQEYGWVKDKFGKPYFTRINDPESEYKTKDLIKPPNDQYDDILEGKKSATVYNDVLRYCKFIPAEEIGGKDIALEWGEVKYQEKDRLNPFNIKPPYKAYCWGYDRGEVLSPIDDAIDPQRMINRMLSVAESNINSSGGTSVVYDLSAVDPQKGEGETIRGLKKGEPVGFDGSKTGGINQAVGQVSTNTEQMAQPIMNIVRELQAGIGDVTAVNEAMTGTAGGERQLVGVLEKQIQQGTLVQELFYYGIKRVLRQSYESMINLGKRIYANNPRKLAMMVGDKGQRRLTITKDMLIEDFRIDVESQVSEQDQVNAANNWLMQLLQLGLIDETVFANNFNNSTLNDLASDLREHMKEKAEARRLARKQQEQLKMQQEQAMAQGAQEAKQEQLRQEQREDAKDDQKFKQDIAKQALKQKM